MTLKPNMAWHFVGKTLRDGKPVPKDGAKLVFHGEPELCKRGFHASRQPFDALQYAPGPNLCLVRIGGTVIEDRDKLVCTERTIIKRMDATEMLLYYARMQALSVVHLWDAPEVVIEYLMTGDGHLLAAAGAAARDAARAAAWAAARDAARAAAGDAARAAAVAAARAAARDAARAAAWDAAGAAARAAARDAAGAAARAAARDAAREEFNALVYECFGVTA